MVHTKTNVSPRVEANPICPKVLAYMGKCVTQLAMFEDNLETKEKLLVRAEELIQKSITYYAGFGESYTAYIICANYHLSIMPEGNLVWIV